MDSATRSVVPVRGQAMLESLTFIATIFFVAAILLTAVTNGASTSALLSRESRQEIDAVSLIARWHHESLSATAIYVPASDIQGASNSDGHEFRFVSQDGRGNIISWAYTWDKDSLLLKRFTISSDGQPSPYSNITSVNFLSARVEPASEISPIPLGTYRPTDMEVATLVYGAKSGNSTLELDFATKSSQHRVKLIAGVPLSGFAIVQERPSIRKSPKPNDSPPPSAEVTPSCDESDTTVTVPLPPPGTENDQAQASNFRVVCRVTSGQIVTEETGATPCVVDGVSHQGIQPRTETLPQQMTYIRQWTPDGGATWENFANVDIVFSDSTPPTVPCGGYGPGSLVTTTYWDGSQTELNGSYNQ